MTDVSDTSEEPVVPEFSMEDGELEKRLISINPDVLIPLILMGLTALVGILGNVILIRSLILYRNLRVDVYVILGGLGLADLIHLSIAIPANMILFLETEGLTTTPWCKASNYISNATSYIAAYHLVVLTVLRGILLTNRGQNTPTGRHAFYCSLVVWVVSALATVPVIQVWTGRSVYCFYIDDADVTKERWLISAFSCFVPILMMFLVYATAFYIGKRYFADSYSRHEKQMSRLVTAVMFSFLVCELPFNITNLIYYDYAENFGVDYQLRLALIKDYFLCLQLFNRALRPILYSKMSSDLGECFDEVINCTYCHRYYSDGPKRSRRGDNANSRAPLTSGTPTETVCEEGV